MARVTGRAFKSNPFHVGAGVKQGCVTAPITFISFAATVVKIINWSMNPADMARIFYWLYGNRLNLWQLQTKTLVAVETINKLQNADDIAFVRMSTDGFQCTINAMAEEYLLSGLSINTGKTKILSMCQTPVPTVFANQELLRNFKKFIYLGFVLSSTNYLSGEVQWRIGLALASLRKEY